ncbi:hypothetical protein KJ652_01355 [Patescibacteria group bacterium]|nr:hypothetical protein [Patescibacteria group bacterium]MBU1123217.1 hypothetical protein [Patescibacteria group bacterium]MBU1911874.1 hypothetical protein [Patescibacteria group bacterium]
MTNISPSTDRSIPYQYDVKNLESKVKNKTELQKKLGWPTEKKRAMFCLPAGMTDELGGELLMKIMEGILSLPLELVIVGRGTKEYGKEFTNLASDKSHRIAIIPDKPESICEMYAACDGALFFKDPSGLRELKECLQYGVVPISPESKKLEPYDPIQESGFAFTYDKPDSWHCFAAIVRALETQKFPFDWRTVQKHCMETIL